MGERFATPTDSGRRVCLTLKGSNLTKGFSNGANPHQPSHSYNLLNQTSRSDNHSRSRTRPIRLYGGILKNNSSPLLAAGGTSDHVHLLVSLSKNIALSILLKDVKKDSSSWIKTKGEIFKDFHWQDGYGAFSISQSEVPGLKSYIANQKKHHRKQTFQEELIQFFDEYEIEYDERYLWN